jgi:hypothetical protein
MTKTRINTGIDRRNFITKTTLGTIGTIGMITACSNAVKKTTEIQLPVLL